MPANLIEDIKSRLDIAAVAGEYLELKPSGRNWVALCPFHQEQTPSLVIFTDGQRYKCFGAGCGRSGDVIDLVQGLEGWDFARALRYLAEKAGIPIPKLEGREGHAVQGLRQREQALGAAMEFFQERLFGMGREEGALERVSAGLAYARGRGWSDEVIRAAGLGCFDQDWAGLKKHLLSAGVDLESPAAVALIGFRGDVAAWGQKFGLRPGEGWISEGKIPAMPPHLLMYPHPVRGRVVYISGRSLAEKGHWNPPNPLLGARQPFYNHLYWQPNPECGFVAIVEGQADAVTLAQWGLPAVALMGAALSGS